MKTRHSFIVRWLNALDTRQKKKSIIDVEHIQSGKKWRVSSIEDAAQTMKKVVDRRIVNEQVSHKDL